MIELIELKETGTTRRAEHVETCHRCQALLRTLVLPESDEELDPLAGELSASALRAPATTVEVTPGALWITDPDEHGFREVVAVVGRSQRDPRLVVVVPVSEEVEDATDADLMLAPDVLGYPALLAVWNHGWIYDDELAAPLGSLGERAREEMTALYLWLVGGGERPQLTEIAGPPITSPADARNLRREEERERLQLLWRRVSRDQEPEDEADETRLVASPKPTFASLVAQALASDEWDEVGLAESATMDRADLRRILNDDLDLTHLPGDPRRVVSLMRVLNLDLDQIKEPLHLSLAHARGGEPIAGEHYKAAARATLGVPEEQIRHDLHTDRIDRSAEARSRRIEEFWRAVVEIYDDFS